MAEDINVNQLAVEIGKQSVLMQQMSKNLSDLNKIITGNGNPDNGMVVKQRVMMDKLDDVGKDIEEFRKVTPGLKAKQPSLFAKHLDKIIPPQARNMIWMSLYRGLILWLGAEQVSNLIPK
jgi:hypothetical protein